MHRKTDIMKIRKNEITFELNMTALNDVTLEVLMIQKLVSMANIYKYV